MNAQSRVQVVVPAYNAARHIADTLESVLIQSPPPRDVVVLDNASNDETARVVAKFKAQGVRHLRNATNLGALGNHNKALEIATAPYLKILSADDVLLPGLLAKQSAALDANPGVGVVTCNCTVTDADLRPLRQTLYLSGHRPGSIAVGHCVRKVANLIGGPSNVLLRREAVGSLRFDPDLKWLGDLDFFCRVLERCDYLNIDEVGFLYRRHGGSDSKVNCPDALRVHDEKSFARRHGGGALTRARIAYRMARSRLQLNRSRPQRV